MSSIQPARIALVGGTGRLGRSIQECALEKEFATRVKIEVTPNRAELTDLKPATAQALLDCDAILEVSVPASAIALGKQLLEFQKEGDLPAWVSGSTGWTEDQDRELALWTHRAPFIQCSNFSVGVLAFEHILSEAAPLMKRLGYTPVVTETHHRHKRDAPSGTARVLQDILNECNPGPIQTHSIRAGEIVGDHAVQFFGASDWIKLEHSAMDRKIFARGALELAIWMAESRQRKVVGIQSMEIFFRHRYIQE